MLNDLAFVLALLVAFQVKHFLADFLLQTQWMVDGKAQEGRGFFFPLAAHALVHAGMTLAILLVVAPRLAWLALVDFAVHFLMDRVKAHPRLFGRWKDPRTAAYWAPFGLDQMVHHLTHYGIIAVVAADRFSVPPAG